MANTSFVITLSTPATVSEMQKYIGAASNPRNECINLSLLFKRLADGLWPANFTVQTSGSAPVRGTNTLTLTYGSISNNDTVVILGTTLTCVTGTPSGAQFKKETNATVTAANLVVAVNANTTLNKLVFASSSVGVVTLTLLAYGAIGNQGTLVGSTGMVVGAATFANGAGGSETVIVSYSRS